MSSSGQLNTVTLREVTPSNAAVYLPQVVQMVRDLAEFEREPLSSVKATVPLLFESFFGSKMPQEGQDGNGQAEQAQDRSAIGGGYAKCVLAFENDQSQDAVGMAVYFFTFSTWTGRGGLYLEDLFVKEKYRGQGISKHLFRYLAQECERRELPRLDWQVLAWNEKAKSVYFKLGAELREEWQSMRLETDAIHKLATSA
ncbi:Peroxygenase 1 [Microbotryomycetes sp. JL221]|nr:Peroxygenase 1 [Microbotryomycetes sp. JL221]